MENKTLRQFVQELGAQTSTPGGGGAAALTAATGIALVSMVANFTVGKKKYEEVNDEMLQILEECRRMEDEFLFAIEEDARVFSTIMDAMAMPKETDEEKRLRAVQMQASFKEGAVIPFALGERAAHIIPLAKAVVERGNKNLITDGAIAVLHAQTAVRSAFYNVRINLQSIKDAEFIALYETKMKDIETMVEVEGAAILSGIQL